VNRQETLSILAAYGLRPNRSLGQNFLIDSQVTRAAVDWAGICREDLVIEIGAGIGALTRELIERAGRVVAIEIDRRLLPALQAQIPDQADCCILAQDALEADLAALAAEWPGPVKVAANLPYYATTPLLEKILCDLPQCRMIVLMVQREFADRILSAPGGKTYGPLAVLSASHGQVSRGISVPAASFLPEPGIDSCLIRINDAGKLQIANWNGYRRFLEACFAHRRKTLVNSLRAAGTPMQVLDTVCRMLPIRGFPADVRAEKLKTEDFFAIYQIFIEKQLK
jgi:16S rRNA (adenine1518-N6/adenine1519-N6)-dimethyltransferase